MSEEVRGDLVNIIRYCPWINERIETHLEYTAWYSAADGRSRWVNFSMRWVCFEDAKELLAEVLDSLTPFVRRNWTRIEVCIPNRDQYGNLRPGFIKDTGMLLATNSR